MICDTSMETHYYCVVHFAKGQCSQRLSSAASLYKRDTEKERVGHKHRHSERRIILIVQSSEVNSFKKNQVSFFSVSNIQG